MVLVHAHWDVRKFFHCRIHQGFEEGGSGIFSGTGTCLHNDWRICGIGGFHNGAGLLEVVHVKCRYAILVLGCVVEQLS